MLVIRKEQMEALERGMKERFTNKTLDFIRINFPEWSGQHSDEALTAFVGTMMRFAEEHDIRKEISIQRLIEFKITFRFDIPLRSQLDAALKKVGLDEDRRLELFVRQLEDVSPLIKLTLEDAPESLT